MLYRPDPNIRTKKCYIEPRTRCRLPCFTPREMGERYTEGNFTIIGEIGGLARSPDNGDTLMADGEKQIPILPRGSIKRPYEWVAGYVPVSRHTYLAAVGGVLPAFLWRWAAHPPDKPL